MGHSPMQSTRKERNFDGSQSYVYPQQWRPVQEDEPYFCSDDGSNGVSFPPLSSQKLFHALESSSANSCFPVYNSPSTLSLSSSGSPTSQQESQSYMLDLHQSPDNNYGSPICGSCITDDVNDLTHKLRELKSAMLGPESDLVDSFDSNFPDPDLLVQNNWKQTMELLKGDLKQALIACARAVAENDRPLMEFLMAELRPMVSVSGDPLQRLGAYMLEGLVARLSCTGSSIYKTLKCKEPTGSELLSYMHLLYEVCPYFKFGYMSANGAIIEAVKDEARIHIIDFQIAQGSQWVTLIQAFAARPGGPPHLRITSIDDSQSAYARGGGLHIVGQRLSRLAQSCSVPFEFHGAAMSGCEVEVEHLNVRPHETLAVNFPFMLHHMPDESVSTENHRDRLLRMIKGLSPKVVTLVEQESNTNTAPFFNRFVETLSYYTAIFESIDVRMPRDHKERISVEQHCLARDIVNIIACEGAERVERHELLGKWRARFMMAGFNPYPLSSVVNSTIRILLEDYCENYRLEERDGVLYLGWMNRALVVSCAWR